MNRDGMRGGKLEQPLCRIGFTWALAPVRLQRFTFTLDTGLTGLPTAPALERAVLGRSSTARLNVLGSTSRTNRSGWRHRTEPHFRRSGHLRLSRRWFHGSRIVVGHVIWLACGAHHVVIGINSILFVIGTGEKKSRLSFGTLQTLRCNWSGAATKQCITKILIFAGRYVFKFAEDLPATTIELLVLRS